MTEPRSKTQSLYVLWPAFDLLSRLAAISCILISVFIASSCNRGYEERNRLAMPVASASIPQTEEPIVALVGRSIGGAPIPYFVLYGDGFLIFGKPGMEGHQYVADMLTPNQVRQVYSSMSAGSLSPSSGHTFTPAPTFLATYFLFIRQTDGNYLRIATYSLPPYEKWPAELRPPESVEHVLKFLAHYSADGASEWTPPAIEVEFQPAVPSPDDRSWWPKTWSQPKVDRSGKSNITVLQIDGSHARELTEYVRRHPLVRLRSGTYDVWLRYPFPYEERIEAVMRSFSPVQ